MAAVPWTDQRTKTAELFPKPINHTTHHCRHEAALASTEQAIACVATGRKVRRSRESHYSASDFNNVDRAVDSAARGRRVTDVRWLQTAGENHRHIFCMNFIWPQAQGAQLRLPVVPRGEVKGLDGAEFCFPVRQDAEVCYGRLLWKLIFDCTGLTC
ncbi:hypothetical protein BaRGS_00013330 [Batillaria attramentaria]|uniref:Uncharacterized protein n=1 Tax=Batillaria attramentaria TaxID=370345 RepID=A0ABD0L805_9CAEN